jgi:TetR/AcrR family transcriptional repressor of nem operon
MSPPAVKSRSSTANDLLDLAETLIQTRGYSAFSYQDLADQLGIRKASIHYHFPSKTGLGIAVVDRYASRFHTALEAIAADESQSSLRMFEHYCGPYLDYAKTPDRVCLCGALSGEMLVLPKELKDRVERFFLEHQSWLARILARGVDRGEFRFAGKPARMARVIFSALQGALLVKRTTGDGAQVREVVAAIKAQISA